MASQPSSAESNARKPPPPTLGPNIAGVIVAIGKRVLLMLIPAAITETGLTSSQNPRTFRALTALLVTPEGRQADYYLARRAPILAASDQRPSLIALSRSPIILSILLNSPIWVMKLLKSHFKDRDLDRY